MGKNDDLKLTTVKIYKGFKDDFDMQCLLTRFSLQKLVNRSIHLFLTDPEFKLLLLNHNELASSGSI